MRIVRPVPLLEPSHEYKFRIPVWQTARIPLLFGPMRGTYWLPASGGKILRLLLGSYEPDQTGLFVQQLQPGDVLFDVGAAVGYYTLLSAPLVGDSGRVVAFEPDEKNAAFLRAHVAANRLKNVDVHQMAVGDRSGTAKFSCGTGTGTGHLATSGAGNTTVSICRLDDIVRRAPMPTHIKIDVEGAELQVLEGARSILKSAQPTLFLSTHGPEIHQACCRYLNNLGYSIRPMSPNPKYGSEVLCTPPPSLRLNPAANLPDLTVLIPCKNERMNIRPCIESAQLIAKEILVADSGSTDETMEIVREVGGCRLIEREFVNYSDFKNWAIPQASHPWVLVLDADERITPELADEIREVLAEAPDDVDGYWVPRRTYFMGHELRYSGWDTDALLRLFRRDRCRYRECRVHEEIVFDRSRTRELNSRLLHYTYWSYDQYFEKYLRYTKWGAQDMWDRGRRTNSLKLLMRPTLRFLQLYLLRRGFLDGMVGIQSCLLQSFFVSFVKQARLWEMEHAFPQPNPEVTPRSQAPRLAA